MSMDRRAFVGGMAALPWLARQLAVRVGSAPARRARSLLVVWLDGGMSHLDTLDGKPEAPPDVRGDLGAVRTAVDGVFVSSRLPRLAARLDRCTLLRSVTHGEGNHDRGAHLLLTGHRPSASLVMPALGACFGHDGAGALPPYVAIPHAVEHARAGFLPAARAPFPTGGDPGRPDFAVADLAADPRRGRAEALRERLDALDAAHAGAAAGAADRDRARAIAQAALLSRDPAARGAFDLAAEPADVRERYGRNRLGQSCLLARRLVRAGVRTVMVTDTGWDHHDRIASALTYGFPPKLDALDGALAALLDDVRDGALDETLVVVASEFGRTPRLNPGGGRDHWPRAQSVLLFGAGVRPGVVGRTDARGEEPVERPLAPEDLHATLVAALGVDAGTVLQTPDGRPVRLVAPGAAPIPEVLRA
jgi:hypothetical protein